MKKLTNKYIYIISIILILTIIAYVNINQNNIDSNQLQLEFLEIILSTRNQNIIDSNQEIPINEQKIRDNIISEAIGIIQYESMIKFGKKKVIEINVTNKDVKSLVEELILIINNKQKIIQKIDWLDMMTTEKILRKYLK